MKLKHVPGYLLAAVLVLLAGTFALDGNLLGKTLTSALISRPAPEALPVDTASAAFSLPDSSAFVARMMENIRKNPRRLPPLPPERIDSETLWLARCIYSETKRPEEMELVAWVVRNRVETGYRGKRTYRGVVLDPYQFSAFNPQSRKRRYYTRLDAHAGAPGWQHALGIAYAVRAADTTYRPFPKKTRHFYSQQSMPQQGHPGWVRGLKPVAPETRFALDERRFRFYEGIY